MKSKGGDGEKGAGNQDEKVWSKGEDEKVVHERNGGKSSGDESSDVVMSAKISDNRCEDSDEEDERNQSVSVARGDLGN